MRFREIATFCLVALSTTQGLWAQSTETTYKADIRVVEVAQRGDTTSIGYQLVNDPSSTGSLESLGLMRSAGLIAATPNHRPYQLVTQIAGRGVVQWVALDSGLWAPGHQSDTLRYSAIGVPGIKRAWVEVFEPIPTEGDLDAAVQTGHPLSHPPLRIFTVAIVPAPTVTTPSATIRRLDSLTSASCNLSWVSSAGICNSLRQKLAAASASASRGNAESVRGQLSAFVAELEAQRGKQVSEAAYWLLRATTTRALELLR